VTYEPLTPEQRAAVEALIGETARPAENGLTLSIGETVRDRREHQHPTGAEDLFCLNLASWVGERAASVLRRLLDAEAEAERLRGALRDACDQIAAAEAELGGTTARPAAPEAERPAGGAEPDGITQLIAPVQALRGDGSAARLAEQLRDSQPDVTAVEVLNDHTIRLTIHPDSLDTWTWWRARFNVDLATITSRGHVVTATGEHRGVTVHFAVEGLPALWAAARGADRMPANDQGGEQE